MDRQVNLDDDDDDTWREITFPVDVPLMNVILPPNVTTAPLLISLSDRSWLLHDWN